MTTGTEMMGAHVSELSVWGGNSQNDAIFKTPSTSPNYIETMKIVCSCSPIGNESRVTQIMSV